MARILVVAGDPGGAAAVAPVLACLRRRAGIEAEAIAYHKGRDILRAAGLDFEGWDRPLSREEAAELLDVRGTSLLLTATSGNDNDLRLERAFTGAAQARGIPSLAVLDFWADYRKRFAEDDGRVHALPDRIAVMDGLARDEMIACGFDGGRIVVTGQPAFDALEGEKARFTPDAKQAIRAGLQVREGDRFVLFLSQPLGRLFADDPSSSRYLGYTEREVHAALVGALDNIAERRGEPISLVLRPHPRETLSEAWPTRSPLLQVRVSATGEGRQLVQAADLVAGMFTILLIEAHLMGCPVISLQPGLQGLDPMPTNRSGRTRAVYDPARIESELERLIYGGEPASSVANEAARAYEPGATGRVIALALEMLSQSAVKKDAHDHAGN